MLHVYLLQYFLDYFPLPYSYDMNTKNTILSFYGNKRIYLQKLACSVKQDLASSNNLNMVNYFLLLKLTLSEGVKFFKII